jgi:hypothetical protein
MKDKTEAAKILLANDWTLEDVLRVLKDNNQLSGAPPFSPYPYAPLPAVPNWWQRNPHDKTAPFWQITCDTTKPVQLFQQSITSNAISTSM